MTEALFQIIVFPIFAILEITFDVFFKFYDYNMAMTIFIISLFINLISLPLYLKAEKLQKKENEIQKKLKKRVQSIKKYAKGDEKYLLLQTYYRQNNYHPIMAIRTSLSLLLQIPFFTAAYIFFSNLPFLKNYTLLGKANLALPDALLNINGIDINILPVIMTVINVTAGLIYSSNKSTKDKILIWIFALGFLLILYNSPSGLVLYWTYNNIFSLIKNIILRDLSNKKPKTPKFNISFNLYLFKEKEAKLIYFLSSAAICILIGIVIPSCVINASPVEFSFIYNENSPFYILKYVFLQAFGFFYFLGTLSLLFCK